ncbi:hypothetical protein [Leptothoe sp. PORK10 BA2]|uniref:hypothetical protein n=1 Tax=Leptothoe sp. PORK10 BA2 TaxID=3110254 RepID=UPI002B205915|nr:hypothetical protein [Leptothoe sp. PORK10 BA2]MEA5465280.1 hypothetical protein [Leptothoe sp. PORK10 BA2]
MDYGLFAIATFYILRYLFNASAGINLSREILAMWGIRGQEPEAREVLIPGSWLLNTILGKTSRFELAPASTKSSLDSWELLELLVKNLQANNMAILEINQRLAEQLGKRGNDDDT